MDGERRAEITAILMTLLTEEADSRVLQAMIPTIVEIGGPSINDIAQSNRYAVRQYIADSRTAVLTQMPSLSHYKTGIVSLHQDQRSPNGAGWHFTRDARDRFEKQALPLLVPQLDFSLLTDGERDAMEATEPEDNALKSSMSERVRDILFELTAGRKGDLGQNSSTWNELQDVIDRKEGREQATQSIKRLPDEIRRVYLTGMVLSRLMARHSGAWDNINLDGVSLLSADLRGLKARGLNMPNAFIVGDARGSDLAEANFSGANLLDTNLSGADLSYATLDHALLPSQDALGWPSGAKAKQRSNMNGANWWSALNGSLSDKREIVGISLAAEHPDQTMGFTYRCPQLDPTPDERKEFGLLMTFCDFPTYDPSFTRAHPVEAGAALRVKHFGKRPRPATFSDRYN
ncbi:MAG: pentapeptide repeat-containing protein [Alphaproteobacteria bacterium]|nr:pentapeptide repeat-containing protein [Alphaproteobacteria bacterium]